MKKILSEWFLGFLISAVTYTILFYINAWLTNNLAYGLGVNWIYLPAGLRLFLTLIYGLPGAIGIALASFMICYFGQSPPELITCIGIGLISGFAPYLARAFVLRNINILPDLSNLTLQNLVACILIFAALSAGLHQWWFALRGLDGAGSFNHFLVMMIGDVLGTVLLIGLIKYGLDLLKSLRPA
ncbi:MULTISPECIES: hypothetical protein [unclassified Polynucleobacter]|uniref:hypothetical protein n=1 Tax=unclassified Polynucleobacter TaxID=2640945 RepID=UPI0008B67861|nr:MULTISPECIES: hypothetical protein [unclassified Polynucleobacter]OHC09135.1 MAG: hypothetical protein A2X74_05805 [Polynucleobacter sp. GWA2_45_21]HBK42961.1 hypothetical protein [Polynucleobacter sp.]